MVCLRACFTLAALIPEQVKNPDLFEPDGTAILESCQPSLTMLLLGAVTGEFNYLPTKAKMSEEKNQPEKESGTIRPDPLFKEITRQVALQAGLQLRNVELPQLLLTDLLLQVPQDKDLSGTLFDFLGGYEHASLEFKSENDDFNRLKFARTLSRSFLFYAEEALADYTQLLTVFVCAKRPVKVLQHLAAAGTKVESDPLRPWLLRCRLWQLNIAFVICRLLPLEKPYYEWLMFTPAGSPKWTEFVKILIRNREKELLDLLRQMRPKEFNKMTINIPELLKDLSPEELEERNKDLLKLIDTEIDMLAEIDPKMTDEFILNRLAKLSPEQRQKILSLLTQTANQSDEEKQKPE